MTRLNPHAATVILSIPLRSATPWYATGHSRIEAEQLFCAAVTGEIAPAPAYRVVAQYKVDQYDGPNCNGTFH